MSPALFSVPYICSTCFLCRECFQLVVYYLPTQHIILYCRCRGQVYLSVCRVFIVFFFIWFCCKCLVFLFGFVVSALTVQFVKFMKMFQYASLFSIPCVFFTVQICSCNKIHLAAALKVISLLFHPYPISKCTKTSCCYVGVMLFLVGHFSAAIPWHIKSSKFLFIWSHRATTKVMSYGT